MSQHNNIFPNFTSIKNEDRALIKKQIPMCIWMTGLSGSGKNTIANEIEKKLFLDGMHTFIIDGDNLRSGLCKDLGFSESDRDENIRRAAELAKSLADAGLIVIVSLISPLQKHRSMARNIFMNYKFIEVFIDSPLEICEKRDIKGLYKKARLGEIKDFTGIDSPFEPPIDSDIHIKTSELDPTECLNLILEKIYL